MGFFDKIKKIGIFNGFSKLTDEFYDELEESLILADMGMDTTMKAVDELRRRTKERRIKDTEGARNCMKEILAEMLTVGDLELDLSTKPSVVLFIGVNGVGKTTTIGKIGHASGSAGQEGHAVLRPIPSALPPPSSCTIWAERCGVEIVKQDEGADPAAVVFDALSAAKARNADVVLMRHRRTSAQQG